MLVLRLCTLTIVEYGNRWEINLTLWTARGGEPFTVGLWKCWLHLLKSLNCYLLSVEEILRWFFYWHIRNLAIFLWLFRLFSFVNPAAVNNCLVPRLTKIPKILPVSSLNMLNVIFKIKIQHWSNLLKHHFVCFIVEEESTERLPTNALCCAVLSYSIMSDSATPWTVAH